MIVRESRGKDLRRVFKYAARIGENANMDDTLVGPCYLVNTGFSQASDVEICHAQAALEAIADSRPDLKYTVLHLTFSPPPDRSFEAAREECLEAYGRAAHALNVSDRIAFLAFHSPRSPDNQIPPTHLHAVIALPCPETGQSVSMHRLRDRLFAVSDIPSTAGFTPDRSSRMPNQPKQSQQQEPNQNYTPKSTPVASTTQPGLPPARRKTKRRKRDRGLEL
ncbi:hypothetical protein [Pacificispira sp.]|uniref:hypothetical protein n=1 Tax=Pacificispira sp. TaxID=2888761 RepID=UPI003BAD5400